VWNLYGPTETTVYSTVWKVNLGEQAISIGRPIANTQVYILDCHMQPVPVGVPGELHIGGAGLARGYLNCPALTAEKFIPNPFSSEAGARLYKTGDLARYFPNGNIELLGRNDYQVKVRGFRIELGEIEAALGQHPAVRETVVIAREDHPGDKHLVAYVIPLEPLPPTGDLRSFLKQKLPEYMIPSAFVELTALPLMPNGKINRNALPAPGEAKSDLEGTLVAHRTALEESLAKSWGEVLKVRQVGTHDNFFELGGHSLKAMELVSKISTALNIDLPVKLLFAYPTISSLAEAINNLTPSYQANGPACIDPVDHPVPNVPSAVVSRRRDFNSKSMTIERRPLLSLFAAGKIEPVDAAAIGYLPDGLPEQTGLTRDEIIQDWYQQLPSVTAIQATFLGRIATIILPLFASELYLNQDGLVAALIEALEVANKLGARLVSLTGLLPSATNYGQALEIAMAGREDLPKFTTGHATTAATVVLAIERILEEAGRDFARERVGFLGLGSIGVATLRLMLSRVPHPREIILCDVYSRHDLLVKIVEEITSVLGFRGLAKIVESKQSVPSEFYDATFMVGATNVPEVIDIGLVRPGTILVDDSAPHCYSIRRTVERFQKQQDILFTEGGMLQFPQPTHRLRYIPHFVEKRASAQYLKSVFEPNPLRIGGCVLSSLLARPFQDLPPTIGIADLISCLQYHALLRQLGFKAAELHCRDFVLPQESIRNFRRGFGSVQENTCFDSR
jgi:predicted amino acid dehydrogenase/acyl carrier protein